MFTVRIELLHRVIRAGSPESLAALGSPDDHGLIDPGEWPPSPARVFSALVAADGTRDRCRVTDGSELKELEAQGPPMIIASPAEQVLKSPLLPRYVVVDRTKPNTMQDYPARTAALVQPGTRLAPRDSVITYVWESFSPNDSHYRALQLRAARIGYLGCADSPVRVTVSRSALSELPGAVAPGEVKWNVAEDGGVALPIPYQGFCEALDLVFDAFCSGNPIPRSWIPAERAFYTHRQTAKDPRPTVIWLRLTAAVSGRRMLTLTHGLRDLVMAAFGEGQAPQVIHGHGDAAVGYDQARFLALPEVGYRHARGMIRGAAVWLPPGTDSDVIEIVSSALRGRRTIKQGQLAVGLVPFSGDPRPWASNPRRWIGPSRRWASAFPVVLERFAKGEPTAEQIDLMFRHAGLPAPVTYRLSTVPLIAGAVDLAPREVFREGRIRSQYRHMEIEFAERVRGPIAVGKARQLGLGLMVPMDGRQGGGDG